MKKLAGIATLFVGAMLVAFLTVEGLVRWLMPVNVRPTFQTPDADRGYHLVPNESWHLHGATGEYDADVRTNSLGFRGDELDGQRPKILLLGDSFTFGFGVPQDKIFAALLERKLKDLGFDYQVVNTGVEGYSPDHYWGTYHYLKELIHPALVIVAFCEANDFIDEASGSNAPIVAAEGGELVFKKYVVTGRYGQVRQVMQSRPVNWLMQNSLVAIRLKDFVFAATHRSSIAAAEHANATEFGGPSYVAKAGVPLPSKLDFTSRIVRALFSEVYADGSKGFLMWIPNREPHIFADAFIQLMSEAQVPVLDLRPAVRAQEWSSLYFTRDDGHWNEAGHQLAAAKMAAFIVDHRMLPARQPVQ